MAAIGDEELEELTPELKQKIADLRKTVDNYLNNAIWGYNPSKVRKEPKMPLAAKTDEVLYKIPVLVARGDFVPSTESDLHVSLNKFLGFYSPNTKKIKCFDIVQKIDKNTNKIYFTQIDGVPTESYGKSQSLISLYNTIHDAAWPNKGTVPGLKNTEKDALLIMSFNMKFLNLLAKSHTLNANSSLYVRWVGFINAI